MGLKNHVFDHETRKSGLCPCYRLKINDFLSSYYQNLKIDIFTPLQQIPCYCKSRLAHYDSFRGVGSHISRIAAVFFLFLSSLHLMCYFCEYLWHRGCLALLVSVLSTSCILVLVNVISILQIFVVSSIGLFQFCCCCLLVLFCFVLFCFVLFCLLSH